MIAKIAVSAANFAIDKPYSYAIPDSVNLQPGLRVMVPFGRSNRHTEGVVLSVEAGDEKGLKAISSCLDDEPVLSRKCCSWQHSCGSVISAPFSIAYGSCFRQVSGFRPRISTP